MKRIGARKFFLSCGVRVGLQAELGGNCQTGKPTFSHCQVGATKTHSFADNMDVRQRTLTIFGTICSERAIFSYAMGTTEQP